MAYKEAHGEGVGRRIGRGGEFQNRNSSTPLAILDARSEVMEIHAHSLPGYREKYGDHQQNLQK